MSDQREKKRKKADRRQAKQTEPLAEAREEVLNVKRTTCCVVGGGPGGLTLALLLARGGVPATLLEAHSTFDRDFRGDTIHPGILEILDEIGLADRLHQLQHVKMYGPTIPTADGPVMLFDFRRLLKTRFPYIMWMPQPIFVQFLAEEASKYPCFRLVMGANVLSAPLKAGRVRVQDVAEMQRRREWPTRFIQAFGAFFLKQVIGRALRSGRPIRVPRFVGLLFRLPLVPKLFAWLVAFGLWQVYVRN